MWMDSSQFVLTRHAVQRFRERIAAGRGKRDLLTAVRRSVPAGRGLRRQIRRQAERMGKSFWVDERRILHAFDERTRAVFVLRILAVGRYRVVTCWKLEPKPKRNAA